MENHLTCLASTQILTMAELDDGEANVLDEIMGDDEDLLEEEGRLSRQGSIDEKRLRRISSDRGKANHQALPSSNDGAAPDTIHAEEPMDSAKGSAECLDEGRMNADETAGRLHDSGALFEDERTARTAFASGDTASLPGNAYACACHSERRVPSVSRDSYAQQRVDR